MEEKNKGGRPSRLSQDPTLHDRIINYIAGEVPYELAAQACGCLESQIYEWINWGQEDLRNGIKSEYAKFSEAIKQIECQRILEHRESIKDQTKNWQARAWLLERRYRKHFGADAGALELLQKQTDEVKKQMEELKNERQRKRNKALSRSESE